MHAVRAAAVAKRSARARLCFVGHGVNTPMKFESLKRSVEHKDLPYVNRLQLSTDRYETYTHCTSISTFSWPHQANLFNKINNLNRFRSFSFPFNFVEKKKLFLKIITVLGIEIRKRNFKHQFQRNTRKIDQHSSDCVQIVKYVQTRRNIFRFFYKQWNKGGKKQHTVYSSFEQSHNTAQSNSNKTKSDLCIGL